MCSTSIGCCFSRCTCSCRQLSAGNLVVEQVTRSLLEAAAEADANRLAQITSGLMKLQALGYRASEAQLQQLQNRQQELMALRLV